MKAQAGHTQERPCLATVCSDSVSPSSRYYDLSENPEEIKTAYVYTCNVNR